MSHVFYRVLDRMPEEHPLLLVERTGLTVAERELLMRTMFETFNVPAYLPVPEAVLAILASGRLTGLALCSGASSTHIVPVYEGYALAHAATHFPLAGCDVTEALHKALTSLEPSVAIESAEELKHAAAFVSLDFAHDLASASAVLPKVYSLHLPYSATLTCDVTAQRRHLFACTEIMFQPSLAGLRFSGVHDAVREAIAKCDPELQSIMWDNVVLAGGNTMTSEFVDRLFMELRRVAPRETIVRVIASPERHSLGWQGGSVLLSLPQSEDMWILRAAFDADEYKTLRGRH